MRSNISANVVDRFAKLAPEGALQKFEPGIDTWLWDRNTIRLHRIKLQSAKQDLRDQIDSMIDIYDDVTQFCWPRGWDSAVRTFLVPDRELVDMYFPVRDS